jgi:hypothetical protein
MFDAQCPTKLSALDGGRLGATPIVYHKLYALLLCPSETKQLALFTSALL